MNRIPLALAVVGLCLVPALARAQASAPVLAATTEEGTCALVDLASGAELQGIALSRTIPLRFEASGALLTFGSAGLCRWPVQADAATGLRRVGPPQVLSPSLADATHGSSLDGRVLAIPNYAQGALLLQTAQDGVRRITAGDIFPPRA